MALTVAAAALNKEAMRYLANTTKRIIRLAQKDIKGGDLVVERVKALINEIKSMPTTNYREIQTKEAAARHLDESTATRAQGFEKAAKRAYNDDLVAKLSNPSVMSGMTKAQLAEAYAVQRRRLRDRLRYVTNKVGNNFMTRRAEKLLDNDPKNMTLNQLRSIASKTANALDTKTLTVAGANDHIEKGVALVGEDYRTWSDEQRTAFWEAVHREMEMAGLSSTNSIEVVKTAVNDQKYKYKFISSSDTGELQIILGHSLADIQAKEKRLEIEDQVARSIFEDAFEKHGLDPLPFFSKERDLPF